MALYLFFWGSALTEPGACYHLARLTSQQSLTIPSLALSPGVRGMCGHNSFYWGLGIWIQVLRFTQQAISHNNLPSPAKSFLQVSILLHWSEYVFNSHRVKWLTLKIYKELAHIYECLLIHCNYCQNDRTLQFLPRSQTSQIQPIHATQREGTQQSESLTVCCGLLHGWEKGLWVRQTTVLGKNVSVVQWKAAGPACMSWA